MSQYLPYKNLALNKDIGIDEILKTGDEADVGYIIECDLEFPKEIHDKLKEFPPCPETLAPSAEMLSKYQKTLIEKDNIKVGGCAKLVPHLMKHEKYCIHYRNLKFVKDLGVKVTKVHNVVEFNQKPFLKPYIDFNTEKRKEANNEFEKDFFKLMRILIIFT